MTHAFLGHSRMSTLFAMRVAAAVTFATTCALLLSPTLAAMAAAAPTTPLDSSASSKAAHLSDILPSGHLDYRVRVDVKYPSAATPITDGQRLKPSATAEVPSVTLEGADAESFYTLVEVDPDAPDPSNPVHRSYLHWMVVDIPGNKAAASSGHVLVPYHKSIPPHGAHRYMFLVYEQPQHSSETDIRRETPPERTDFNLSDWAMLVGLQHPVGFSWFVASKEYENTSDL